MNDFTGKQRTAGITVGAAGIAAIAGVEPALAQMVTEAANVTAAAATPNWLEPLFQGIIAILTILLQFFGRPKKKKR